MSFRCIHQDEYDAGNLFTQCDCEQSMEPAVSPPGSPDDISILSHVSDSEDGFDTESTRGFWPPADDDRRGGGRVLEPDSQVEPMEEAEAPVVEEDHPEPADKGDGGGKDGPVSNFWAGTAWNEHKPPYVRQSHIKKAFKLMAESNRLPDKIRAAAVAEHVAPNPGPGKDGLHWHMFFDKATACKRGGITKVLVSALLEADPGYYRSFKNLHKDVKLWMRNTHMKRVNSYRGMWEYVTAEKEGFKKEEHGYRWHVTSGHPTFKTGKVRAKKRKADDLLGSIGFHVFRMSGNRINAVPYSCKLEDL